VFLHLLMAGGQTTSLKSVSSGSPTRSLAVRPPFAKFYDLDPDYYYF